MIPDQTSRATNAERSIPSSEPAYLASQVALETAANSSPRPHCTSMNSKVSGADPALSSTGIGPSKRSTRRVLPAGSSPVPTAAQIPAGKSRSSESAIMLWREPPLGEIARHRQREQHELGQAGLDRCKVDVLIQPVRIPAGGQADADCRQPHRDRRVSIGR